MNDVEQMLRNQLGRIRQENVDMSYEIENLKVKNRKNQDIITGLRANVKSARESRDAHKLKYKQLKESIQSAVSDAIKKVVTTNE